MLSTKPLVSFKGTHWWRLSSEARAIYNAAQQRHCILLPCPMPEPGQEHILCAPACMAVFFRAMTACQEVSRLRASACLVPCDPGDQSANHFISRQAADLCMSDSCPWIAGVHCCSPAYQQSSCESGQCWAHRCCPCQRACQPR